MQFQEFTVEQLQTGEGVLVLNQMLRFLFDNVSNAGENTDISWGYGTPEAAQTKEIGSIFLRLDGGASTTVYIKESGSGATGWVAK